MEEQRSFEGPLKELEEHIVAVDKKSHEDSTEY